VHERRRPAVDQARSKMPILDQGIVVKVLAHLVAAIHSRPCDELEPHLVGEHVAYGVEVARVEPLHIGREERAFGLRRSGHWCILGLLRQRPQARAATMQRSLDRRHAAVHDPADLVKRIAEHVHQNDAAALRRLKTHESAQAGGCDLAISDGRCWIDDHFGILVDADGLLSGAAAQKVQRRIVGDAKQPAFRMGNRLRLRKSLDRLHQRLLDHILAVDDRAGHAGAVTMQFRSQLGEKTIQGRAGVGHTGSRRIHAAP
jgi:hypothetical protein